MAPFYMKCNFNAGISATSSPFISKDEVDGLGYHISTKPLVINHKREW